MGEIKAIETRYKGYRFRSRLEARWAVFFDALNIEWEYEPEGFVLSDGQKYLPDFLLPTFSRGMYVEVKPNGGDFSKAAQLAQELKCTVWFAEGIPDFRAYLIIGEMQEGSFATYFGIPNADSAFGENRMYSCPGYENEDGSIDEEYWEYLGDHYKDAVFAARSARFEYGENA